MDRNDLDDISRALRLLIAVDPLEARLLLRQVLDRNGRTVKDPAADALLEARRARMVQQLERGLTAGKAA